LTKYGSSLGNHLQAEADYSNLRMGLSEDDYVLIKNLHV